MNTEILTDEQWAVVEELAAVLRHKRVSVNLVRQAMTYATRYSSPVALRNWLLRLTRLGDTFASGKNTAQDRQALAETLRPAVQAHDDWKWAPLLGWVARLMIAPPPEKRGPGQQQRRRR